MKSSAGVLITRVFPLVCAMVLAAGSLRGATFVVPDDREMIRRADIIVTATAGESVSQLNNEGGIETVTPFAIAEALKGSAVPANLDVYEPGGSLNGVFMAIPGSPRFTAGERVLLFLKRTGINRWSTAELVLGKFSFHTDGAGHRLLLRDADQISGFGPDLKPHVERPRDAEGFLRFIRSEVAGVTAGENYFVAGLPAVVSTSTSPSLTPSSNVAPFTATSYTMIVSGTMGSRWTQFPNAVTILSGTAQEPGAPNGGLTAINDALAAWDNDCGSNVNYAYGGTTSSTTGLHSPDGINSILFEQDLSAWGIAPFSCSPNGYSGTLGIGGITNASGTINTVNGESFVTTLEADVEMNKGIANCTLLFSNGDFNSAVTHEVGHTLGFRHSDQNRSSNAACSTDPSLECSSSAIMTAFITAGLNATLQTWDQHAVDAVYPGNVCAPGGPPTCTPPSITSQPASATITKGSSVTLSVGASGTTPLSYQWYFGTSGTTTNPISGAASSSLTVTPSSTTSYWVRVSNSCGSANSATATVTVNAPKKRVLGDYTGAGRTSVAVWRPSTGEWLIDGLSSSVVWGVSGDQPVPADYNGDGITDIAVWRPSTGVWYIRGIGQVTWGVSGDIPVPGDYNGDGRDEIAVFRPSTGEWFIRGVGTVVWGQSGDIPVPADYNGDGVTEIAVFRPSNGNWYIRGVGTVLWGMSGDQPMPADFNGDGKAEIAVWRPSSGTWYVKGVTQVVWGQNGDTPVTGDYNGDGMYDLGVWRSGTWYIRNVTTTGWGQAGDIPLFK